MRLSNKQLVFVNEYLIDFNATQAAIRAGYSEKTARQIGSRLLANVVISSEINRRITELSMSADETLLRIGEQARSDMGLFFKVVERDTENPLPTEEILSDRKEIKIIDGEETEVTIYTVRKIVIDLNKVVDPRYSGMLQEFTDSPRDGMGIKITNKMTALQTLAKIHRLDSEDSKAYQGERKAISIPADLLAPKFLDVYRDIQAGRHMEYLLKGGRGSTKSSFTSLEFVCLLVNNPTVHGLALRQVANTLRDSVYSQIVWAINELGLTDNFKCITSPLEITYLPTNQKIYFRGADAPEKIKSIKPTFGHIGILWFEELDQFHGPEDVRKIEQSVLRGGEEAWEFKTYNPPPTAANWVNKYILIPKANQYQHHSTFLDVPHEWLGQTFIDEAEHLKSVNERAYKHEYLGEVTGTGGLVFENVQLRAITDEEISQFDHVTWGGDWGYYPDPADFGPMHFDAARRVLYIFGEYRAWKKSNKDLFEELVRNHGLTSSDMLILDSAEPKSVADFRQYSSDGIPVLDDKGAPVFNSDGQPVMLYGPTCRGAEKGPESVKYSIKWLQGLTAIVIDPERAPYAAEEFVDYEYEQDPDGNFISEYPDRANHSIDRVRYGTNLIWRKRGQ